MWLLEQSVLEEIQAAISQNLVTAADQADYIALYETSAMEGAPRNLSINGDRATISVKGVLTDAPSFLAYLFGGGNTVYSDIRSAHALAESDPSVKQIYLHVDSPGGMASSEWVATIDQLNKSTKSVIAIVGNQAASAAYGLVAQAEEIIAHNRLSSVGSIGVVASLPKSSHLVEVVSSNAPNKRPDPNTDEGKKVIRSFIDAIENEFIESIAKGRKTDKDDVKKNYGRGAMFLASEAVTRGMIDHISGDEATPATAHGGQKPTTGAKAMDLETLKAEHPAIFSEAVELGVSKERKRVNAHFTLAEGSGAVDLAIESIKSGADSSDPEITSQHMKQAMLKGAQNARAEDDADNQETLDNVAEGNSPQSLSEDDKAAEEVADLVAQSVGNVGNDGEAFF